MAQTKYSYTISTDSLNAKVDSGRLTQEIQQSAIVTALNHIDTANDIADVWFNAALSTESAVSGTWTWDGTTTVLSTDTSGVAVNDYIRRAAGDRVFKITAVNTNVDVTIENPDTQPIPSGTGALKQDGANPGDEALLQNLVKIHDGTSLASPPDPVEIQNPQTADKRIRVAVEKSDISTAEFYSHNWCDSTTWWENATRVVDEVATDSGDQLTYDLANATVIDVYHGKITKEDDLKDSSSNSYLVVVKVNDVTKTEQDPHVGSGGDYTFDYTLGKVTFLSALQGADVVKVTYHYAGNSVFTIKPEAGKLITIELTEVQFSGDVVLNDTVVYEVFGKVEIFAPSLTPSPYPAGTLIPIRTIKYKTMADFQNSAIRAYPSYPALGGAGWRGMSQAVYIFDWDYLRGIKIESSKGMEIRMSLEHDAKFGGTYGTATIYASTETEPT